MYAIQRTLGRTFTRALATLALTLSPQAFAQSGEEPRWYQVEIAIFTQPANAQIAANAETFRKDVSLSYGNNTQYLRTLDEAIASLQAQQQQDALLIEQTSEPLETETDDSTQATEQEKAQLLATAPFIKLPQSLRGLNDTIAALARRNRQEVLFHEAWRQPVVAPEAAPAIVVSGGETFGEDQTLGGTIALGVARYLHLNTNLWFAEFAENYGQGDLGWPNLPPAPARHPEDIQDESINLNAGQLNGRDDLWAQYEVIDTTYQSMLTKPYVVTNLATLTQDRRMRSGEVHYIDHPKIGIMVYVTPYELPEQDALPEPGAQIAPDETATLQDTP
ncbi:peptidoglycan binding protein CsiV [Simiduia sp. 21SJ11W-1]|uniref:CsiV family protein n=1 Tax=Simiduia sp. 21SJ11W-1 TaxID=2909669 RepID=UPI00209EB4C1|nr:CsiV family protein [Simiduia sp. 21SJ11W-1]UTA49394.1 peptidoglycan binding protein CsiV [Simiduia sp. 21SJ11W-1]